MKNILVLLVHFIKKQALRAMMLMTLMLSSVTYAQESTSVSQNDSQRVEKTLSQDVSENAGVNNDAKTAVNTQLASDEGQHSTTQFTNTASDKVNTPEVGKHVMANMDASSMILSLLMVLALIIASALLLKRFNLVQQGTSQLKVVASLPLGAKERVVVVQAGAKQLVLGVTSAQVTLIDTLSEPLAEPSNQAAQLSSNILSMIQKTIPKKSSEQTIPKNNTERNNTAKTT